MTAPSKTRTPQFSMLPWYPRDFASSTRTWPLIAKAVYRELLDAQWDIGGGEPGILPHDADRLRALVGATKAQWKVAWPFVADKFQRVDSGGGLQNTRLEQHREGSVKKYHDRVKGAEKTNRLLAAARAAHNGQHGVQPDA